ncbi:hypothetical protein RI578_25695 [Streptomyces sp. BB1-1-1]|uniref:hypothetical protein n=1 Tax=Streptomyces sp. BB1-1-1 TaxID=3074430 RepID=UPI0028778769|nr:hypothetical protein [Streptomyces sp. BB1-1-1]WND37473.1 hypothetical protein RI578_25695 [Streptomyces sp. BB1-1-1]
MRHRIARLAGLPLLPLLALLLPGSGRRRRRPPATEPAESPYTPDVTVRRTGMPALRGEDNVLVRPYLLAHERQEETRRRQARRRALRFAVHGIDLGPRVPHDVEVAR